MGANSKQTGLLTGGGIRGFKVRRNVVRNGRLIHFPDVHISDTTSIKELVSDFDPALEFEYSPRELLLLAEKILLLDGKPRHEAPAWLTARMMIKRLKHEVYCANGVPDPSIASGLYWRTHPQGRKWNSMEERRQSGKSFYR